MHDAQDMAAMLRRLNFNVDLCMNTTLEQLRAAVSRFTENLSGNEDAQGFFYFAGLGNNIYDNNYLVPVDADTSDIINTSYGLSEIFDALIFADNTLNIVIVDACFTNYFPGNAIGHRGITEVASSGASADGLDLIDQFTRDIFFFQAAMHGQTAMDGDGRNSPFTTSLLNNLTRQERFIDLALDIINNTIELSDGQQHPYFKYVVFNHEDYILKR